MAPAHRIAQDASELEVPSMDRTRLMFFVQSQFTSRHAAVTVPVALVIAHFLGVAGSIAEAQTPVGSPGGFVAGEVLIKYAPQTSRADVDSMRTTYGLTMVEYVPGIDVYRMRLPAGMSPGDMVTNCILDARCEYAEPNYVGQGGDVAPNDPFFPSQWHLDNVGQTSGQFDADIDAVEGWQRASGSSAVVVAILDSGIDFAHPEFQGRIVAGYDFVNEDDDPQADHPHGVFVAGILAANADNDFGVAGVDRFASLMPIKVLNAQNLGTTLDLAQGLVFAAGTHVINMSLINYPLSATLLAALQYARDAGSVLVACAGNGGIGDADLSGPGASPLTISVGATDHNDARASFSGTGMALDVVAPGVSVTTVSSGLSNARAVFSGCSAATPIASGIASILLSVNPQLTHDDVQKVLEETADDLIGSEGGPGGDEFFGHGRVNLNAALESLESPPDEYFEIVSRSSGKCLDVYGASTDPVAPVIQWSCHGRPNQHWRLEPAGGGAFRLIARHSGQALDVVGALVDDVTPIIQYPVHSGDNQVWMFQPAPDGYVRIVAQHSGKAMDVEFASPDDGAPVIQYTPHGGANQQWLLRGLESTAVPIRRDR
jgi:thermitase